MRPYTRISGQFTRCGTSLLRNEAGFNFARLGRRWNSNGQVAGDKVAESIEREGTLFVDSIFPIRLGTWDIRHYLSAYNRPEVINALKETLSKVKTSGFKVESVEPRVKDGGAFVKFKYTQLTQPADGEQPLDPPALEAEIKRQVKELGGIKSWLGDNKGDVWLVRGRPWKEDMRRYASNDMKVYFEGPDIYQETLYDILRHYGQVSNISNPVPVPAGNLRYSTIQFSTLRAATRAHNCVHGFTLVDEPAIPGLKGDNKPTRLATVYERKVKTQAIWDWLTSHPRIVVPVMVFLLGSLSYLIFDPIRSFMVQAKVVGWLDYHEFRIVKWIRRNTIDRFSFFGKKSSRQERSGGSGNESIWKDRKDAENTLRGYLSDLPSTIAFVHGPQGSGKSSMLTRALKNADRHVLVIDCELLNKGKSDADVINGLAAQTGYWPVFTWFNNFTNLIDLASVGLIGQKTGLSSSVETQLKEVLEVVGNALKGVSTRYREFERGKEIKKDFQEQTEAHLKEALAKIQLGTYHDGRVDAVAGTGVTSELGIGDEKMTEKDEDKPRKPPPAVENAVIATQERVINAKEAIKEKLEEDPEPQESFDDTSIPKKEGWAGSAVHTVQGAVQGIVKEGKKEAEKLIPGQWKGAKEETEGPRPVPTYSERTEIDEEIRALPVVVIKNYATKTKFTDELVVVLADWAAGLADGGIAHVVVMSDNRDNGRKLEKALPAKPLTSIAIADADSSTALSFVQDRLAQYGVQSNLTRQQKIQIDRLGGRSSDLEALCHKVKNGMPVEMAVEDIITRGVAELRKNAFGEEEEEAKSMRWSPQQVFFILKALSKSTELPYYDVLLDFPFKGDEAALRSMEHAELISITTSDGRPSTIRPGRPVYRYVFERLVNDEIFRSVQDIALNDKAIASAESTIRACEDELLKLEKIRPLDSGILASGASRQRADFLLKKMYEAETKLEKLEAANAVLKKGLKKP
ncbi:Mitochondrial escape protein 2 Flags: Precursor [Serendipita indica DSM 11827]|uniref:Mitochondrial escape protein 2 n=1 Tax=Serendipita indica (strain DSM 11827) TaxID=1109443 RepID=G4TE42_SERID|nr:Mitochondrial escape protein 2 Flags: Precursor [Serendipita indica DSM 11827]CCA69596.1 related to mitochondrial rRNA processing protein PRP12 [Serendipita indica DSM 11827]